MPQVLTILFVGGPLHGTVRVWPGAPDYHPHAMDHGAMVPYTRRTDIPAIAGADAIYAPVGMTYTAITESLSHLSLD